MPKDTGPHPNAQWTIHCPQYVERYDWITTRAETWFDQFRENSAFDFDKPPSDVARQQIAVESAYHKYAQGLLTIEGVIAQARMLKEAYRIKA